MIGAEVLAAARGRRAVEHIGCGPQAGAGQKVVLHAGARQLLQIGIGQVVVKRSAGVLMRDLDAAHAFVVGRERDRHMGGAIEGKGMLRAFDRRECLRLSSG